MKIINIVFHTSTPLNKQNTSSDKLCNLSFTKDSRVLKLYLTKMQQFLWFKTRKLINHWIYIKN